MNQHLHAPQRPQDLLDQEAVKDLVREAYRNVVGAGSRAAERLYSPGQLARLPRGAIEQALGVGNPVQAARLQPGETVADLGCGGGIDTILAAQEVAPQGRAIGLDMLPEMLEVAAQHAREAGVANVEWVLGEIEAIPLPAGSCGRRVEQWCDQPVAPQVSSLRGGLPDPEARRPDGGGGRRGGRGPAGGGDDEPCGVGGLTLGRFDGACLRQQAAQGRVRGRGARGRVAVRGGRVGAIPAVHRGADLPHAAADPSRATALRGAVCDLSGAQAAGVS